MIAPPDTALLVVDMQRDFLPGGALPIPGAELACGAINHYVAAFEKARRPIYFSRDWHPPDHSSFRDQGGRWPPHCIAGTKGAELAHEIRLPEVAVVVSKGTELEREAYSAFEGTGLGHQLRTLGVREVWVAGVATEYAVRASVLDALRAGFGVTLLLDAMRAADGQSPAAARALEEMLAAGAKAHSWARSGHYAARSPAPVT